MGSLSLQVERGIPLPFQFWIWVPKDLGSTELSGTWQAEPASTLKLEWTWWAWFLGMLILHHLLNVLSQNKAELQHGTSYSLFILLERRRTSTQILWSWIRILDLPLLCVLGRIPPPSELVPTKQVSKAHVDALWTLKYTSTRNFHFVVKIIECQHLRLSYLIRSCC